MNRLVLGSGLLRRGDDILLVRCHYESEPKPLWVLPGGGQEVGESITGTVRREFLEETSLEIDVGDLAYVSESVDATANLHVLNCTFWVHDTFPNRAPASGDPKVVEARFVSVKDAPALLSADVLRIPVSAALGNAAHPHYFLFRSEDIIVPFFGRRDAE
jgi:ADP-ribose pyrophosphatase YjhB (NUDIX family)